jgi:hypothetical protein
LISGTSCLHEGQKPELETRRKASLEPALRHCISLLLIKNLIVVCLSWFCHLRVLPSVNLHRSCPHARNLHLHSRLRASLPVPPRCVSSTRSPSHQPSLIAPLACPNLAATLLAQCDRATAPPDAPRTMCSPWQSMASSAIAAQICLTHEGEDRIRSTMATRNRLCAMDLYEVLLLTTRPARRASTSSIYRCGSGGTSLCSATRSSEGGGARGAPDSRGGRGRGHGRTLERMGSASMRWGVRWRCSSPPPPSSSWAASRQGATQRRHGNSSTRSVPCTSGARPEEEAPRVCKLWDQSVVLGASEEKRSHCCVGHATSLSSSTRSHRLEVSLLSLSAYAVPNC